MRLTRMALFLLGLGPCLGTACSRPPGEGEKAAPSPPDAAKEPAKVETLPAEVKAKPAHWTGTYKTTRGTFYVPSDPVYAGTKWRGDDGPEGLGEGPIELTIDPASGQVDGTLQGVLGPSVVYGSLTGDALAATVARKDIADRGFSGTLFVKDAKPTEQALTGTMKLSLPDAHLIRDAHFTLKRKDP